jgi:hypothetical protein
VPERFTRTADFAAKQARVDRAANAELLDYARADAADLISGYRVTRGATQAGKLDLNLVGLIERQR